MSRTQQDQFIDDDEEETCPLCVEEFDLTDKGFRPCPCGYQICQFCYHNVKNNMNGLCPACRRPYEEKNIEYKVITPEETAAHRARQAQRQKKTQAAQLKEKQKAEADHLSRKHLAGLRVVQKNLVYVTGLSPTSQEDQLLQTLRGDQYFGQYGKIIKIVVSKARDPAHPNSVGVYVTYERKEDAQACIAAVNGSKNGERTLRAQFGTTKYCSAYLRNEQCTNRNCMFLHEPGEANESYSRADLSALNAGSSQQGETRNPPPQPQQPIASAAPISASNNLESTSMAPDRPALPSTASWASKAPLPGFGRPESRATASSGDSPAVSTATPFSAAAETATTTTAQQAAAVRTAAATPPARDTSSTTPAATSTTQPQPSNSRAAPRVQKPSISPLIALLKNFLVEDFAFKFDTSAIAPNDLEIIRNYPPLFDANGGARRRARRQQEEEQRRVEQEALAFDREAEQDDIPALSGSQQLGGEPEERQSGQGILRSPDSDGQSDQIFRPADGAVPRGFTPQSHQQLLLQTMKGSADSSASTAGSVQSSVNAPPGHQRNVSRYSFANDTASASLSVKPVASTQLLNQQSSMMPSSASGQFGAPADLRLGTNQQFFTSNVQGPPPGLKTTGTPPVSGGMTFGQGHGFATGGLPYGANAGRHSATHEDSMRNLLRGPTEAAAKRDVDFPPLSAPSRQPSTSINASRTSTPPVPPGFEAHAANESRRSTPSVPPGFGKPSALPQLDDEGTLSRPLSRVSSFASLRRGASQHVVPVLPLRTGPSSQASTPSLTPARLVGEKDTKSDDALPETPTKPPRSHPKRTPVLPETEVTASQPETSSASASAPAKITIDEQEASSQPSAALPQDKSARASTSKTDSEGVPNAGKKTKAPGKLDISAALADPEQNDASAGTTRPGGAASRLAQEETPLSTSKPSSPTGGQASPAPRAGPKTLRLVGPSTPLPTAATQAIRQLSRQPSMASMNNPGTPSSEQIFFSDNVSITSTSVSRANSPPPIGSKVGTAPVRTKTKNQIKKERQERAKAIEEEKIKVVETENPPEDEPAQEAIVSRKKKAKKEKEPKVKPKAKPSIAEEPNVASPVASPVTTPGPKIGAAKESTPEPQPLTAPVQIIAEPPPPHAEPSPPPTPTMTPATLFAEIKALYPNVQKSFEAFCRSPATNNSKASQNLLPKDPRHLASWKPDFKVNLTKEEVEALMQNLIPAVRYGGGNGGVWDRGLITPSGIHFRAMTEEVENRLLQLEKILRETPDELRFHPSKPQNETKFPTIDLEELCRQFESASGRTVNAMEQMVQDTSTMKKGAFLVDDATHYINEFVMPPATPPPSAGKGASTTQAQVPTGHGGKHVHAQAHTAAAAAAAHSMLVESLGGANPDIIERQQQDSRRASDERDGALRKIIKKNKKLLGLG